ncbi:MAG: hypothetical protein AAF967_14140 [Pseudomonadota bacterium]
MQTSETQNGDTEILRLFREYQAVQADFGNQPQQSDEADAPYYEKLGAIKNKMMALSSTCAADFAAKAIVDTENGELLSDWVRGALWKEARELVDMPFRGLAGSDMKKARERLQSFGEWTGTTPPKKLLNDDQSFSHELLLYCQKEGLSLDWLVFGDVKGLVMESHNNAKAAA